MSEQDQIIINGLNLNSNVTRVLSEICVNLQKQYDISPKLINILINSLNFLEKCIKANEQGAEALKLQFQKIDELEQSKNIDANTIEVNSMENSGWESEKCGYLIKSYPNGFKKYCNEHKYLHATTCPEHEFVFKTPKQISEERTYVTKLDYYQEYLNKLLESFQDIMKEQIKRDYSVVRVKLEEVLTLNEWLRSREDCFKTKFILNEVTMSQSNAMEGLGNKRMEYGNYIDIYIPHEKLEKYLVEMGSVNYAII